MPHDTPSASSRKMHTALVAVRRARWRKPLMLVLCALALGWLTVPGSLRFGGTPTLATLGSVALLTPQGRPTSLTALAAGKPTVVNLWASWCPPCRREMPLLAEAQQQRADLSFVFANQGEDAFTALHYLDDGKLALRNLVLDPASALGQSYGSMALPITLFFDARGRLVDTHLGALSTASLARALNQLETPDILPATLPAQ